HLAEGLGGLLGPVVALRPRADRTAPHLALGRLPLVVGAGGDQALGGLAGVVVAEEGPELVGKRPDFLGVRLQLLAVQATHIMSSSSGITETQHHTTNRSSRAPAIEKIMLTTPELHGPAP